LAESARFTIDRDETLGNSSCIVFLRSVSELLLEHFPQRETPPALLGIYLVLEVVRSDLSKVPVKVILSLRMLVQSLIGARSHGPLFLRMLLDPNFVLDLEMALVLILLCVQLVGTGTGAGAGAGTDGGGGGMGTGGGCRCLMLLAAITIVAAGAAADVVIVVVGAGAGAGAGAVSGGVVVSGMCDDGRDSRDKDKGALLLPLSLGRVLLLALLLTLVLVLVLVLVRPCTQHV
jgi:hypothetical protein